MRDSGWRRLLTSAGKLSADRKAAPPFEAPHGIHGWIDGHRQGRLRGWVLATARPDEPLDLVCRIGCDAWRAARADHHRADVQRGYGSAGYHGFAIPVSAAEMKRGAVVFALVASGCEVRVPGGGLPASRPTTVCAGSRRLHIDPTYRGGCVSGWFVDDADPLRRCMLRFEQDGRESATVRATRFRPDLLVERGDALHGFSLAVAPVWPLALLDADRGDELIRLR